MRNGARVPRPLATGGGQEHGLRPGTVPVTNCVGFGVACDLAVAQCDDDRKHVERLSGVMLDFLSRLDGWQVNGSLAERIPHNLSIAFQGGGRGGIVGVIARTCTGDRVGLQRRVGERF